MTWSLPENARMPRARARLPSLLVFAAFIVPAVAGCIGQDLPEDADATDAFVTDTTALAPVDMSLTGCFEMGAGRLVSFEHAQSLLPPGFVPGDAADFLGMPMPTGRALVLTGHLDCEWSVLDEAAVTWADLLVYVETPTVPGLNLADGRADLYQIAHYSSGAATVAALESVSFHVALADVRPAFAIDPMLPLGSASSSVDGEALLRFDIAAAPPQPYDLHARFWQQTPTGLAYVEHDRTSTYMHMGGLTACAAAEGSTFAEAFGVTDCTGSDALGGVFPERTDFTSTLHFLPGATAGQARSAVNTW